VTTQDSSRMQKHGVLQGIYNTAWNIERCLECCDDSVDEG